MQRIFSAGIAIALAVVAHARDVDVRSMGAKGDGRTDDTAAIRAAIVAACADGGGTVFFPAGDYLSFTIELKSHLTLHLGSGATLVAADPPPDLAAGYAAPEPNEGTNHYQDFGHSHWRNSLITGEDLAEVTILGPGVIFGRGLSRGTPGIRRDLLPIERAAATKPELALPATTLAQIATIKPGPFGHPGKDTLPAGVGNKAIALKNCRNVIFRDFTIFHGGHFAILATGVDNWTCDNLKIDTNRDGIDVDCCQNVRISNCTVNAPYDDAICLKSSYALGRARPAENVTITNCQVSGYDEGSLRDGTRTRLVTGYTENRPTGRIKCGTESNGGFRNITISNCVFDYSRGLALESVDGALMEDIAISNLTMRDVLNAPIYIRLGARLRGPGAKVGTARRIRISNIVAHNVSAESGILLAGLSNSPIEDVWLENIFLGYAGGGTKEQGARAIPEDERGYPEPTYWGVMPAAGLWARHVRGLTISGVELRFEETESRPVVALEDVRQVEFSRVRLSGKSAAQKLVKKDVEDLVLRQSLGLPDTAPPTRPTAAIDGRAPIFLRDLPLLFADNSGVAASSGVVRTLHPAHTRPAPVLEPDRAWEGDRVYVYGTVLRDEATGDLRLWYMGNAARTDATNRTPTLRTNGRGLTLFATSRDGVAWTKPSLGLHAFDGSTANNIVFDLQSPSVLLDRFERDPARRYKMFGFYHGNYHAATSPDGLHWTADPHADGVLRNSDTITLSQNPTTGEYLAYHKRPDGQGRTVWLARSRDFSTWTEPERVFATDQADNAWATAPEQRTDVYDLPVVSHAAGFIGFPAIFRVMQIRDKSEKVADQSGQDGPIEIQLATSRDGREWHRTTPRVPIIPRGAPGTFDGGAMLGVTNSAVDVGDETWIYYTALNTGHGAPIPPKRLTIGRAEWRRHGFVSLDAGPAGGRVETIPLQFVPGKLIINADAHRGALRVALLEADGRTITGFTATDCEVLATDATRWTVQWRSNLSLPTDRPVRVVIEMTSAQLFSLSIQKARPVKGPRLGWLGRLIDGSTAAISKD